MSLWIQYPAHGSFGPDTIIDLPNSLGVDKAAMEMVTTLIDNTSGSEDAQFVIKLITAGTANTTAMTMTGLKATFPAGQTSGSFIAGLAVGDGSAGLAQNASLRLILVTEGHGHTVGSTFFSIDSGLANNAGYFMDVNNTTGMIYESATSSSCLLGGGTKQIRANSTGISFLSVTTPVAQYATTGTSVGFTAGAGTTVTHLSTFTGNTGATAYTIADIVRGLKLYGLMAA